MKTTGRESGVGGGSKAEEAGEREIAASLGALSLGSGSEEAAAAAASEATPATEAAPPPPPASPPPPSPSPPLVAMDGVLAALDEAISWPSRHGAAAAALGLRWPAGLLLRGPPGTGKTAAVAAAAAAAGAPLVVVSAGSVFGSALGESEARLRAAFGRAGRAAARARKRWEREARESAAAAAAAAEAGAGPSAPPPPASSRRPPCCGRAVLLLDDVEVLAPARSAAGAHEARVVAQLLTLLDGAGGGPGSGGGGGGDGGRGASRETSSPPSSPSPSFPPVVVIATTSRPGSLDPALRRAGRLDREVSTSLPDAGQREEILRRSACAGLPLSHDVDLGRIAAEARGYSGADLVALAREAARGAMAEAMKEEGDEGEGAAEGAEGGDEGGGRRRPSGRRPRRPRLVTAADFAAALPLVGASVSRGAVGAPPPSFSPSPTSWDDVGGIEDAKSALRRAVELPLRRPAACARLGVPAARGVLLFGPPGCSKTTLAAALATAAGASLHVLSAASLFSAYVGEGEAALRAAFAGARAAAPAIVFLDEADAVGGGDRGGFGSNPSSGGADSSSARMLAALLAEVDGLESGEEAGGNEEDEDEDEDGGGGGGGGGGRNRGTDSPGAGSGGGGGARVLLLAATNRPWALDPALLRPGRLDCHVLVPPPDARGRGAALRVHCRRVPLAADADLAALGAAAPERTTGAELAAVAREAALAAAREGCDAVHRRHFERALEAAGSSSGVSRGDMQRYEAWGRGAT